MAAPGLSELVTTSFRNHRKRIADNVSDNNELLRRLKKKGNMVPVDGGTEIVEHISHDNSNYQRYSGYDILDVSAKDRLTSAKYDWSQSAESVAISGEELMKNSGKSRIIPLLNSKLKAAEKSMMNGLSGDIYSDGTADGGRQIDGLQLQIPTDPTMGTNGGIDRSAHAFWRSQIETGATAANMSEKMQALWLKCCRGMDKVDLIVADNVFYNQYWNGLQEQQRFTSDKGNGGFKGSLMFNSAEVVADGGVGGDAPASTMFFLNTDYLHWRPHKNRNIVMVPKREAYNQDAEVHLLFWMGNLTCSSARLQGRLTV